MQSEQIQSNRETVLRKVNAMFPPELVEYVLSRLDSFGTETYHKELDRVRLAILKLSDGDVAQLEELIEVANADWRDVLMAAEYRHQAPILSGGTIHSTAYESAQKADLDEYTEWLNTS